MNGKTGRLSKELKDWEGGRLGDQAAKVKIRGTSGLTPRLESGCKIREPL